MTTRADPHESNNCHDMESFDGKAWRWTIQFWDQKQPKHQHSTTGDWTGINSARSGEISSLAMKARIVPWRSMAGCSHEILHLYLGPQFTHRYVSSTTIEAVVHMTSTVGKTCVQLQGQVQWVEKVWWFLHKHRESGWRSIYLGSKGNHPQMALIQVSEILYFFQIYVGGNYIVHISKKIIYRSIGIHISHLMMCLFVGTGWIHVLSYAGSWCPKMPN